MVDVSGEGSVVVMGGVPWLVDLNTYRSVILRKVRSKISAWVVSLEGPSAAARAEYLYIGVYYRSIII